MFRLGAAREILERMGSRIDSGDVSGIFRNPNMRARLQAVFPDADSFDEFIALARVERTMQDTRNDVLRGSQTAGRQAADEQFSQSALGEAALDMATGGQGVSVVQAVMNLGRQGAYRYLQGLNEEVGGAIGRMVTQPPTASLPAQAAPQLPVSATGRAMEAVGRAAPQMAPAAGSAVTRPTIEPQAGWIIVPPEPKAEPKAEPASLASRIVMAESAGRADAKNPRSSATGAGQFIEKTWLDMVRRHKPEVIKGKTRDEILALRNNPALSREMVDAYARENAKKLRRAGVEVGDGSLYLAHFAGPGMAVRLMKANPDKMVRDIMSPAAIKANPFLKNMRAGEMLGWAESKVAR